MDGFKTRLLLIRRFAALSHILFVCLLISTVYSEAVFAPISDLQNPSFDHQQPLTEYQSNYNNTMSETSGYRAVAYYVNWVRQLYANNPV